MIDTQAIKQAYIDLYVELRRYIWDIDTVECLAEFEGECYKAFPDIKSLRFKFDKLNQCISSTSAKDEELKKAIAAFRETIDESDASVYSRLQKVEEVIPV